MGDSTPPPPPLQPHPSPAPPAPPQPLAWAFPPSPSPTPRPARSPAGPLLLTPTPPPFRDAATLSLSLGPPSPSPSSARRPPRASRPAPMAGDPTPCTECGRRFDTWKALFGHMRCHPERHWRGITPPPLLLPAPSGGGRPEQDVECAQNLVLFSSQPRLGVVNRAAAGVTRKRRLGGSSSPRSPAAIRCDDGAHDYACVACGHKRLRSPTPDVNPPPTPEEVAAVDLDLRLGY